MEPVITTDPEIMHGSPCFAGTRVEVKTFFDHIEGGCTVEEFLEQFPTVSRQQVMRLLQNLQADAVRAAVPA